VTNVTNVTNVIKKDNISTMSEVTPFIECCCAYCACTPSVGISSTFQCLCCNTLVQCCKEADEGCICTANKIWFNCTGCTCCKCGEDCCCLSSAAALPCHKDIPCRLTVCCVTLCPTCGCCKTVNHAKVMTGAHGAPPDNEMER